MTKTQIKKALIFAGICVALVAAFKEGNRYLTKRFSPEAQAVFESSELTLVVDIVSHLQKGEIFSESKKPLFPTEKFGEQEPTRPRKLLLIGMCL